jgi:hypothetical protein
MNATWARLELDHSNPDPRGKSRPRISPPKRVPKGNHLARPELLCREERRETNTSKKCHRPRRHQGEGGAFSLTPHSSCKRPDPPRRDGSGACHNALAEGRVSDQLINAAHWSSVRFEGPAPTKKAPGVPGLLVANQRRSLERPESLDAPILSQGTNQARRGTRKRPAVCATGRDLPHRSCWSTSFA